MSSKLKIEFIKEIEKYNSTLANPISVDSIKNPIVTGQQVGLFLTPALSLYKAFTALKLAKEKNSATLFWLQTEDHDFDEIRNYNYLDANFDIQTASLEKRPNHLPISKLELKDEIYSLIKDLNLSKEIAEGIEFSGDNIEDIFANLLSSYSKLAFEDNNLIFIDPIKTRTIFYAKEIYRSCIENFEEISLLLRENYNNLKSKKITPQVELRDNYTIFFLTIDSKRQRLEFKENKFHTKSNKSFSKKELLELLESNPEKFSSSALLRPVIQDYLLNTNTYVGGKAELNYLKQTDALFDYFKVKPASRILRGSVTVVEEKFDKWLGQIDAEIEMVFNNQLAGLLVDKTLTPENLKKESLEQISSIFEKLENAINKTDETLLKTNTKSKEKVINTISNLLLKYEKAITTKNETWNVRIKRIKNLIEPNGIKQERLLSALYFHSKFGNRYLEEVFNNIEAEKETTIKL